MADSGRLRMKRLPLRTANLQLLGSERFSREVLVVRRRQGR